MNILERWVKEAGARPLVKRTRFFGGKKPSIFYKKGQSKTLANLVKK